MSHVVALVIDADRRSGKYLTDVLCQNGIRSTAAETAGEGFAAAERSRFDLLFLDLQLPDRDGIGVLTEWRRRFPECGVVVMSRRPSIESCVAATRLGICDYLFKPITTSAVQSALDRALTQRPSAGGRAVGEPAPSAAPVPPPQLVAVGPAMKKVAQMIAVIAGSDAPILLRGEVGVGKELVARVIHQKSARREGPFVRLACGGDHLESFLFGPAADGSAVAPAGGFLEQARGGTLLLTDVEALPAPLQVRLHQRLTAVDAACDVRLVAATQADLESEIEVGRFRRDFYDYLNLFSVELPPLRRRPEDVEPLVRHFLEQLRQSGEAPPSGDVPTLTPEALDLLRRHDWPGNVGELAAAVRSAALLAAEGPIQPAHLPAAVREPRPQRRIDAVSVPIEGGLKTMQLHVIREVIRRCDGNKTKAAQVLGLHRRRLYRMLGR